MPVRTHVRQTSSRVTSDEHPSASTEDVAREIGGVTAAVGAQSRSRWVRCPRGSS